MFGDFRILLLWSLLKPKCKYRKQNSKYLIANACLFNLVLILIPKWNVQVSLSVCVFFMEWYDAGGEYAIGELIDHDDDSLDQSYLVFMLILCKSDGQFVVITIQINVFVSQSVSISLDKYKFPCWYLNQLFIYSRRFLSRPMFSVVAGFFLHLSEFICLCWCKLHSFLLTRISKLCSILFSARQTQMWNSKIVWTWNEISQIKIHCKAGLLVWCFSVWYNRKSEKQKGICSNSQNLRALTNCFYCLLSIALWIRKGAFESKENMLVNSFYSLLLLFTFVWFSFAFVDVAVSACITKSIEWKRCHIKQEWRKRNKRMRQIFREADSQQVYTYVIELLLFALHVCVNSFQRQSNAKFCLFASKLFVYNFGYICSQEIRGKLIHFKRIGFEKNWNFPHFGWMDAMNQSINVILKLI